MSDCHRLGAHERLFSNRFFSVILAKNRDLSVTTEHERAAICAGATDASCPAGLIRACRLYQTHPSTDEPSVHPWHQTSIDFYPSVTGFQAKAGIQILSLGAERGMFGNHHESKIHSLP